VASQQDKVSVRQIMAVDSPWLYVVYFHTRLTNVSKQQLMQSNIVLEEFIRTGFSSTFKLVKTTHPWFRKSQKVLNYVKLSDDSDLFTLMLCHASEVRKIFKVVNEQT
jgi:hypothetical protein